MATETPVALGWGRGERMLGLRPLPRRRVQLIVPPLRISATDAYRWLDESAPEYEPSGVLLPASALQSWEEVEGVAENDFEVVVGRKHPELIEFRETLLRAGAKLAMLAGSGSTVFGVFEEGVRGVLASDLDNARIVQTRTSIHVVPIHVIE